MIEKIPFKTEELCFNNKMQTVQVHASPYDLQVKINELVETVNVLIKENNIHEKQIDELQMKVEPDKTKDPYAEQRKWIGHLVEYGNADDGFKYGILTNVEPIYDAYPFEIDNGRDATADCWLPHESIIYKE